MLAKRLGCQSNGVRVPLSNLKTSLFAGAPQTQEEKAAVIAAIGSEAPEALNLDEIRAICRYVQKQMNDVAAAVKNVPGDFRHQARPTFPTASRSWTSTASK